MKIQILVYLSKAWRTVIPRMHKQTEEYISEIVQEKVEKALREINTLGSLQGEVPKICTCRYKPNFLAPDYMIMKPWEMWSHVQIELEGTGNSIPVDDWFLTILMERLPEQTHITIRN